MRAWVSLSLVGCAFFVACGESTGSPGGSRGEGGSAGGVAEAGQNGGGKAPRAGTSGGGALGLGGEGGAIGEGQAGEAAGGSSSSAGETSEGGSAGNAGHEGGAAGAVGEPDPPNVVFVTSIAYSPQAWGGLEGADEACASLAQAAELPGTFVAWLSTSGVDAKDRLGRARGWRNTRQNPFADEVSDLVAGRVYFPIAYDENGDEVTGVVATGTLPDGTAAAQTCSDWTSDAGVDALVTGEQTAGAGLWTAESDGGTCADDYRLYCFQIDHQHELYPTPSQGRTVFVSSEPFVLGAQGRASADALCAADAAAEQLDGTFVALLPTSTASALARLVNPSRPWVRPDGMVVASSTSWFELFPRLGVAITEQADGTHVGGVRVFGAASIGDSADLHCEDWTDPNATVPAVIHGITGHTDDRWYAGVTAACSESAHVLCVEQ